jgi:TfoX/Sxy family transcriptional regulator of competence genes
MAYDERLAERVRKALARRRNISEKQMFGGLSFLQNGKMLCGVLKDLLVVRLGPEEAAKLLAKPHVRPMDFTGKAMKGFLYVEPGGTKSAAQLSGWIGRCVKPASSRMK